MSRRSGLGRGLGSLIPAASPETSSSSELRQLPLDRIRPNPLQPRKHFDEESLAALVDSIKAVGILQPVLVRVTTNGDFELIAGERRFRAAHRAGLATVPALIRGADDAASLEQALVENLHREDLNALDEAGAYQQLIEDFGLTHEDVAKRVGKSRAAVTNALRLFQLPPSVQRYVRDGLLTAGHGRALLATPDRGRQEELGQEAAKAGMSVRALEDTIRASMAADAAAFGEAEDFPAEQGSMAANGQRSERSHRSEAAGVTGRDERRGADPGLSDQNPVSSPPASPPASPADRLRPPGVLDLEELLGDHLNTRVTVDVGQARAGHHRVRESGRPRADLSGDDRRGIEVSAKSGVEHRSLELSHTPSV